MKLKKGRYKKLTTTKKYNYGLGLLKAILAFYVVRTHNFNYNSIKNKILSYLLRERKSHVPSFFIMSFYFMRKDFLSSNIKKYLNRIERLLIPYILWPIIFFILNNYILNNFIAVGKYSFNDLKYQFLIGQGINGVFYFHWNLIVVTTIFFYTIYLCKKKYYLFLIQAFGCFAYFIQYSGYNKKFTEFFRPRMRPTLGRFFETIPYASTGFTLSCLNILNIVSNYKIQTLFFCLFIFYLLDKYYIFTEVKYENLFSGILYNVRANCLIFIFSLFPSNKITNIKIEILLKIITNYTVGVYFLHNIIIGYFKNIINPIKNRTLFGILIIYLICYLICFIGMQIFGKTKLKNLFS